MGREVGGQGEGGTAGLAGADAAQRAWGRSRNRQTLVSTSFAWKTRCGQAKLDAPTLAWPQRDSSFPKHMISKLLGKGGHRKACVCVCARACVCEDACLQPSSLA